MGGPGKREFSSRLPPCPRPRPRPRPRSRPPPRPLSAVVETGRVLVVEFPMVIVGILMDDLSRKVLEVLASIR